MKKFSVVLLILALVASFAFAGYSTKTDFDKTEGFVENKSWATVAPADSVVLNGTLGAEFAFDFDKEDCAFGKSAGIAYFDLSAAKTIFTGVGSVKGEGAVYAAADASISLALKDTAEFDTNQLEDDGTRDIYSGDGSSWKVEKEAVGYTLSSSFKLAINNFYIAKDGAWQLNLLKSDASLDYAKSSLTSMKAYLKNRNFTNEDVVKAYATFKEDIKAWTGVTFTSEANPYLAEIAFGYEGKKEWNVLVKSKAVALQDLTVEGGFVIGTDSKKVDEKVVGDHLDMGIGINADYTDDYVALKAAADFGIQDMKNKAKFDCDVYAQAKAFGATLDFYYATNATHYAPSDYEFIDAVTKYNKYIEAKAAYAINYADVDFEVGFVAKDLNWKTRTFGATFAAKNDFASFDAEVDFTKDNGAAKGNKKELKGDFDVTFKADYFDAYADFEFARRSGEKFTWGLNVGVETDKIVDACTFGLDFNFTSKDWSKVDDISKARKITAFCEVAF